MQTHIIQNGVVVNTIVATVEQAQAAFPEATVIEATVGGPGWLWDGEVLSEPVEVISLDDRRERLHTAINTERDRREEAGFGYLGKVFDSNSRSVARITVSVQAAQAALAVGAPFSVEWTTQDNSKITLDAAQMMGAPAALAQYADALHVYASARKAVIATATDAELLVFDVLAGWPV